MNIRYLTLFFLLGISHSCFSQELFEGEIVYSLQTVKKDSSFDISLLRASDATRTDLIYKEGNFLQKPDTGTLEYYYFKQSDNKTYSKYKNFDTLVCEIGERLLPSQDSVYTIKILTNTDTLLGYVCNRFVLHSPHLTLTLIFCPKLAVDEKWFEKTKFSYYDVIYAQTHSLFLKSIAEFESFVSILSAEKIIWRKVANEEFPDISIFPKIVE